MSILDRTHNEISHDFFEFALEVYKLLGHFRTIEEFERWLVVRTKPINSPFYIKSGFPNWGPFPDYSYPFEVLEDEWKEMGSLENGDEKWWYVSRRSDRGSRAYIVRNLWLGEREGEEREGEEIDLAMQEWIMFTDQKLEWIQRHPSLTLNEIEFTLFENSTWEKYLDDRGREYEVINGAWISMNSATVFFNIPKTYLPSRSFNYPQGGIV